MPDNQEKNRDEIEKLLREYAQYRNKNFGEDCALTEKRRQYLLNEALKTHSANRNFLEAILLFIYRSNWVKLGFAIGALAIFAVIFKSTFINKQFPEMSLAKAKPIEQKEDKALKSIVTEDDKQNVPVEKPIQPDGKAVAAFSSTAQQGATAADSATAGRAKVLARENMGRQRDASSGEQLGLKQKSADTRQEPMAKAESYDLSKKEVAEKTPAPISKADLSEKRAEAKSPALNLAIAKQIPESQYETVLRKFNLEIRDSKVILTDEDGSIYEGEILKKSPEPTGLLVKGLESKELEKISKQSAPDKDSVTELAKSATENDFLFNVRGTNQRINAPFMFYGKIIGGNVLYGRQNEVAQTRRYVEPERTGAPLSAMRMGAPAPSGAAARGMGGASNDRLFEETAAKPSQKTNLIIEGFLFINGKTNLKLRAIRTENGYFQKY